MTQKKSSPDGSLPARVPLSKERILQVALDLADQEGLDALSMRQIAQGLGVEAMSLYKHVANKEALLDEMVEWVVAEMGAADPAAEWQAALFERARTLRRVLNLHPWAASLIESRSSIGPERLRHNDRMIGILRSAGFSIELAFHAMIALTSYVYGFVILEEGNRRKGRPKAVDHLQSAISPSDYPYLFEMIKFAYSKKSADAAAGQAQTGPQFADFEFGLRHLVAGFEAVLREMQNPPSKACDRPA
ncbi:AcrR family transcriptional regulator [Paucibacter oligotrophus]|uniref:AcrR family transcriptional regulator n=1 Tax=Roseateles oligotrophus TaxID=1769250 RepID=A0A840LH36_9BURK|nr:TetR/AcrR family transcriptional regulator [Roseateles oligotrophus]MBB4844587.1 AcrR family transcriptional regulator [Roseateles oligotrophus]